MNPWTTIYFITSFLSLIISIILCRTKFKEGNDGNFKMAFYLSINYIIPLIFSLLSYNGNQYIDENDFNYKIIMAWVSFGMIIALGIFLGFLFYHLIKKHAKKDNDDFAFNWAFGLNG